MTAPEQAMTPEERELVVNVLRNYHRDHAGDPEFGAWPQIAHRLAERLAAPATQRDDTAELVEALELALGVLVDTDLSESHSVAWEAITSALDSYYDRPVHRDPGTGRPAKSVKAQP